MIAKNHFEDCPYHCNDKGMLLDTIAGKMIPCPHCSTRKKELLREGYIESDEDVQVSVTEALGIKSEFLSTKFIYESVIPDGERVFFEEKSMEWQKEMAEELYLGLTVGTLPEESMCFGLAVKGRVDRFAFPMLAKAYMSGLVVSRLISCSEWYRMRLNLSDEVEEFLNSDFLIMLLDEGFTLAEIASAKGLMQSRALKGKPTIFVTTWTIEACSELLGFKEESSCFIAKPIFVKYKSGKKHSRYINNLFGQENESMEYGKGVSMMDL